ncbi:hypothetical protein [Niabella hibiscisoli]|uniref:hypothetical protein n=1 Tax=Niabella hibiscisoli TaxID=1825928 RepID=UPI001F0FEB8D|nr:hypothetical protein [Niabella hibiscisoli]MCH5715819.1 hypothetical protein [Niabella hibiscisoli]
MDDNNVTGKRSVYILSNRVNDIKRLMGIMVYNNKLTQALSLTAGANYQQQVNHYYQEVKDLLGGDFGSTSTSLQKEISLPIPTPYSTI